MLKALLELLKQRVSEGLKRIPFQLAHTVGLSPHPLDCALVIMHAWSIRCLYLGFGAVLFFITQEKCHSTLSRCKNPVAFTPLMQRFCLTLLNIESLHYGDNLCLILHLPAFLWKEYSVLSFCLKQGLVKNYVCPDAIHEVA